MNVKLLKQLEISMKGLIKSYLYSGISFPRRSRPKNMLAKKFIMKHNHYNSRLHIEFSAEFLFRSKEFATSAIFALIFCEVSVSF